MVKGIRRVIKIYGKVDPKQEEKRQRHAREYGLEIMRPHSGLVVSVKPRIEGERK